MSTPIRSKRPRPTTDRRSAPSGGAVEPGKATQLLIDLKYANDLPKPVVPKLLRALPSAERLYRYNTNSLELDHRNFFLMETNLSELIEQEDPLAYGPPPVPGEEMAPLAEQDELLLLDDDLGAEVHESARKKLRLAEITEAYHREAFGLQLPQLITNDVYTERQNFITGTEAPEKKMYRDPPVRMGLEDIVARIESTFEAANEIPTHPDKPKMKPKRILSVVPDAVLWSNKYRQVAFDELEVKPAPGDLLFKTVPTPRLTCYGYFAPSADEGAPGSFRLTQNYLWDNRGDQTRKSSFGEGETVLLSIPPPSDTSGEARFVTIPPWIRLKKQKAFRLDISCDTKGLSVNHRDPSTQEAAEEAERMQAVLSDEVTGKQEDTIEFIDGEWRDPKAAAASKGAKLPTAASTGA